MKFFLVTAYFKKSIKRFLFIFLLLFYPLWLNAAEPWVYVTNNGSDSMTIINTATDEVLTTLPVGKEPHEVAITKWP
jgi:YVTN family beta-propeller protein